MWRAGPWWSDAAGALDAIDGNFPVLLLVDLGAGGDWAEVIRRVKLRPHTKQIPVYAFGSHVDAATLRAARERRRGSRMGAQPYDGGARARRAAVRGPACTTIPDGWDDALSAKALAGIDEFNRGDYFEQHELLEEAWMEEPRRHTRDVPGHLAGGRWPSTKSSSEAGLAR